MGSGKHALTREEHPCKPDSKQMLHCRLGIRARAIRGMCRQDSVLCGCDVLTDSSYPFGVDTCHAIPA